CEDPFTPTLDFTQPLGVAKRGGEVVGGGYLGSQKAHPTVGKEAVDMLPSCPVILSQTRANAVPTRSSRAEGLLQDGGKKGVLSRRSADTEPVSDRKRAHAARIRTLQERNAWGARSTASSAGLLESGSKIDVPRECAALIHQNRTAAV